MSGARTTSFDLAAPFYDLGIWMLCLFFGGEEKLRGMAIDAVGAGDGSNVVELLCGTATLSLMAARRGSRVTGVDSSGGMLRVAREKFRKEGLSGDLVRADAAEIPLRDGSFDGAVVSLGLHEIEAGERVNVLDEAARVLKDGGALVIFDFHKAGGITGFVQRCSFHVFEEAPVWSWLDADIQGLLKEAGFKNFKRTFLAGGAFQLIRVER